MIHDHSLLSINDSDTGHYWVNTEHSSYEVDLTKRTIRRTSTMNALRGDDGPVELLSVGRCEVGKAAVFYLVGLADGAVTERVTTVVQSIERAA